LLAGNCGKRKGNKIGSWDLPKIYPILDYNVLLLSSFSFFFLCLGCPAIVAVLVIVGRDMGRGAGEDA
jgi:hypothetical protein